MDVSEYFKSLSLELTGLKNRVRNYIQGDHWGNVLGNGKNLF